MWISQPTRAEFLGIVQAERKLAVPDDLRVERSGELPQLSSELMVVWQTDPSERPALPSVIMLPDRGVPDFLAWTATYLTEYRPLTAQIRILDERDAGRYFRTEPPKWLGRLQNVYAAMVLAETISHLEGDRDLSSLPGVAFANTYSFSRARDLVLWGTPSADDRLFESWRSARNLMRQSRDPVDPRELKLPWSIIARLEAGTPPGTDADPTQRLLTEITQQVFVNGMIGDEPWAELTSRAGLPDGIAMVQKGSREERVEAFESLARQTPERAPAREIHAFLCGYLANAIAPGSFDHWSLALRSSRGSHGALLWYGLFAGLASASTVRDAFNGLGRRILRDIVAEATVLDRPKADLSLPELEMLTPQRAGHLGFFTASSGTVHVEIAPCIGTLVRWPGAEPSAPTQEQLFERTERRTDPSVELALLDIRRGLDRVEGAHRDLLQALGLDLGPRRPLRRGPRN